MSLATIVDNMRSPHGVNVAAVEKALAEHDHERVALMLRDASINVAATLKVIAERPKSIVVSLTLEEMERGALGGVQRHMHALEAGLTPHYGNKEIMALHNILGCWSEIAVCKLFGFPWSPTVGKYDQPDAGPYQVRASREDNGLNLSVRDKGKADKWLIATKNGAPNIEILGCMLGREAMTDEFKLGAGWFVGASKLKPLHQLPRNG